MPLKPAQSRDSGKSEEGVRKYYDHNTNLFLKLGAHGMTRAIHQPLFVTGTETLDEALHTQHRLIFDILQSGTREVTGHILDLGCGVGAALQYLAPMLPEAKFTGITLSPNQAETGEHWLRTNKIDNARILCGSYQALPESVQPSTLAYAIESFIHATSAELFFSETSRNLLPDGSLVIFDDLLSASDDIDDPVVKSFIAGWKANALYTVGEIASMASNAGLTLVESRDLSAYQSIWRLRDRWVSAIQPFLPILPLRKQYKEFLKGGNARQHLFRSGKLKYTMLVLRNSSSTR